MAFRPPTSSLLLCLLRPPLIFATAFRRLALLTPRIFLSFALICTQLHSTALNCTHLHPDILHEKQTAPDEENDVRS